MNRRALLVDYMTPQVSPLKDFDQVVMTRNDIDASELPCARARPFKRKTTRLVEKLLFKNSRKMSSFSFLSLFSFDIFVVPVDPTFASAGGFSHFSCLNNKA